ncbi:MAG: right-handed parallel beta-helix repeat-containing protein [Acidimicrobiia bacterium]|nr:right-handed parallel beta-helix repeat-containing protein [Acidimicrobiia bacterium]
MKLSRRDVAVPAGVAALALVVVAIVSWLPRSDAAPVPDGSDRLPASTTTVAVAQSLTSTSSTTLAGPQTRFVLPGDDLAAMVAANPPLTTFVLAPGIHRGHSIEPRDGQVFRGEPGAVLSGAVVLSGFAERDGIWFIGGQGSDGQFHGQCDDDRPRCGYPEELFVDDAVLEHVESVSAVGPGRWHFDYDQDTVYLGNDPAGRVVELGVVPSAFHGDADNVTIEGLVIEKYAAPAQEGVIDSRRDREDRVGGSGWQIIDNVVRWNHGVGIAATTGAVVAGNQVYENGQLGLAAKGLGVTIEGNEIYGNNTAGFNSGWEAGGSKFAFTSGLVVRNNHVHDNDGPGLWTDIDNIDTRYEGNRVIDNDRMGIFHEISYDAVIADNEVRGNGFGFSAWLWGAGIAVSTSINVEIYGNVVEGNGDGIVGIEQDRSDAPASYGPLSLTGLDVHDNFVSGNEGWSGVGQDIGSNAVFTSAGNRFYDNTFDQAGTHFFWLNEEVTYKGWLEFGQS